jgi:hypothetical protein
METTHHSKKQVEFHWPTRWRYASRRKNCSLNINFKANLKQGCHLESYLLP